VIISALSSGSNFMPFDVSLSECFMASRGTKHHLNSVREAHEINGTIMKCRYQPRHTQFILLRTADCISSFRQFVATSL
jgi:Ran GTPase-activating protein (RanGAP) involved in mRNA processing and transport